MCDKIDHRTSNDVFQKLINGIRECKWCHKKFENITGSQFANHVRWCKENPNRGKGQKEKLKVSKEKQMLEKYGPFKEFEVVCANVKCKKHFFVTEREKKFPSKKNYFCSKKCAHSFGSSNRSLASRQKTSNTMKQQANDLRINDPKEFNRRFGLRSTNRRFSSKYERLIRDFIIENFPNDGWTYGGHLIVDNLGISRDLYSDKLKICFEYDGIWHFKDIHDQLKEKQEKDKALEKWCIEHKYRLIRISESWFFENLKDLKCIVALIYDTSEDIIKCGKEYLQF